MVLHLGPAFDSVTRWARKFRAEGDCCLQTGERRGAQEMAPANFSLDRLVQDQGGVFYWELSIGRFPCGGVTLEHACIFMPDRTTRDAYSK